MRRISLTATALSAGVVLAAALGITTTRAQTPASVEPGRFVWHDLMTKNVAQAKRFYGSILGWRFEDTTRGGRPYAVARAGSVPVAGLVDVSALPNAGSQWLSFMAVTDLDKTIGLVQSAGGKLLVEPRDLPRARAAVVADPQGAPLGLAQMKQSLPDPAEPTEHHFFWQEYLARDAGKALAFYKQLAGYDSAVTDTQVSVEYHVLRKTRGRAGLFQLPANVADVEPNWLPYVLVADPAALAARVTAAGGRIVVPAAPDRRKGSLVVIADPGGAVLALQKFPF